jgi:hypothetical protein
MGSPRASELPDSIAESVRHLKGKTIALRTPHEFDQAIDEMKQRVK